uniref:Uncharacterized protein n=1 Tax=Oryza meridionalis TaxID=40149 RepID=A0A0E0D3F7_9ORYZ
MALAAFLLLGLIKRKGSRRGYNLPPGPTPWPYGELMLLRFGSFPVVVGSSVAMARLVLKTHDAVFIDRPRTASGKHTTYGYADITWSPYGAYWRQARRICVTELFSARRVASFEHIRADEVRALVRGLFAAASSGRDGGAVHLNRDHLSTLSMNVITRMVLGKRFFGEGADAAEGPVSTLSEFKWMMDELLLLNGVLNVGDWIPSVDWMDLQGYVRRMKKVGKMFDAFMEHVLDEHSERRRREGEAFVARDMVDVLMDLADDPSLEIKLGRVGVKAFTQDLIAGGTESSSVTVEWALSELLKNPAIFATATDELDIVVGRGRWVTKKDIPNLPYLEAIMKETMRMHPIVPLLIPRVARDGAAVAGYDIPKGARVLINVWTIGRDPELLDAAEEFMPERFIGSRIDVKGQDFELLPFGSGRRMCPGYNLGLKVMQLSLANLLHWFAWRLPEGMEKEELSMDEVFGLSTMRKYPLQVVVEPRLPVQLYSL